MTTASPTHVLDASIYFDLRPPGRPHRPRRLAHTRSSVPKRPSAAGSLETIAQEFVSRPVPLTSLGTSGCRVTATPAP